MIAFKYCYAFAVLINLLVAVCKCLTEAGTHMQAFITEPEMQLFMV